MFKNYDKDNFKSNLWLDKDKHVNKHVINKDGVYAPCEMPLSSDTENEKADERLIESENDDSNSEKEKERERENFFNTDKIKEFTHKLFDVDRRDSLINTNKTKDETNEAYKSDSSDSSKMVKSEYLEVLDDGSDFDYYDDRSKHKDMYIDVE